jgi:predicted membrane-bound spermidine synthase
MPAIMRYLYFTVFMSGMTVLAVELSASRLLGSVFGTSNLVWASIIGLILIYLTAGYFLGGWWADRSPRPQTMYQVLAWGAFTAGIVPLISRPVLRLAADAFDQLSIGILLGSFSAVLILFIVPITLLGTISPFAIRLAIQDPARAGSISGRIYAVSTLGSFVGTFLPVLVLIPLVGTTRTFLLFSLGLVLVALGGLWSAVGWRGVRSLVWMPLLLLIGLWWGGGAIKQTAGQVYEGESAYNYIQVLQDGDYRYLRLNEGQGVHSIWHPTILDYDGPWEQFLAAPFFNPPNFAPENVQHIAIVGLAAGTTARQATAVFGPLDIDGFEIDPEIIRVGQEFFGMDLPNLNAIAQDGRIGLEQSQKRYHLIAVDAYRPPYIPWHLTTREFFELTRQRLRDDGVLAINVGRSPDDRRLIDGLVGTIHSVYPSVYVMDIPYTFNSIVYATAQPTRIENLYNNLVYLYTRPDIHPLLVQSVENVVAFQQPVPESTVVYTDDLAPVEWVTNDMVLSYLLFGEIEELK